MTATATAKRKTIAGKVTKSADGATWTMSTVAVDRDGDRIEQNWELPPGHVPLLVEHDWGMVRVGVAKNIRSIDGGRTTQFDPVWVPEEKYALAGLMKWLYENDMADGISPGFMPLSFKDATPEERKAHGVTGAWIERSELLEISLVNIPANAQALRQASLNGKRMAPIFRGAGAPIDPALVSLANSGVDKPAVEAWIKSLESTMDIKPLTKAEGDPPPMPPAPEGEAPKDAMAQCEALMAKLKAGEGSTAEEVLAVLEACMAEMGTEEEAAPPENTPPPPPAEASKGADMAALMKRIEALEQKTATATVADGAVADAGEEDAVDEMTDLYSNADKLLALTAKLGIAGDVQTGEENGQ